MELIIETIGGFCPVQAEGTVDGKPFYFRARGSHWAINIGGEDLILQPDWRYEEDYGMWPEAGWMTEEEARAFIQKAVALYEAEHVRDQ
jgi:hypothetical protein